MELANSLKESENPVNGGKTNSYYSKKGQTQGSIAAVIALITGVGVAVLVLIFVGVLGGQAYNTAEDDILSIGNNSVLGEALGPATNISDTFNTLTFDHSNVHAGSISIFNTTAPFAEYNLENFTITTGANKATLTFSSAWIETTGPVNNTALSTNYTWGNLNVQDSIQTSIVSGFSALEDTGSYLPLIVLGIIIFLLLGLVLGMATFGGGSFKGGAL